MAVTSNKDSNKLQVTSNIKDSNKLRVTSYELKEKNLNGSNESIVTSNKYNNKKDSLNKLVTKNSLLVTDVKDLSLVTCHLSLRIGIIRDSAFQFYYPENIEELKKNGAEIIEINAIEADRLPDIDALYIGGGFPETNAIRLAENVKFKDSVRKAAESGLPIYAECGGLMFLGQSIISNGRRHPMVGIFPITFEMKKKPQAHGYTIIKVEKENPFYPIGTKLHGHEFHYSAVPLFRTSEHIYFAFKMKRGQGIKDKMDGICYKNVLASYTHIHAYGAEEWVRGLINKAKEYKGYKSR